VSPIRSGSWLLGLVPLLGLIELGLHQYFARRAPGFQDYATLAPQLMKLKQPGIPVVVAPDWAEPLLRQAAPSAFPLEELARADNSAFEGFLEVSVLGQAATELSGFPVERSWRFGKFAVALRRNPNPSPPLYDFVAAVAAGQVEVFSDRDGEREVCPLLANAHSETGGLHGHVAYPRQRFACHRGSFAGVGLIDDQDYRARRCILVQPPTSGRIVLRFNGAPQAQKLRGYAGFSYFLERDQAQAQVVLRAEQDGRALGIRRVAGDQGWSSFEWQTPGLAGSLELSVRALAPGPQDLCFALEAH
jgi:hypothetical protein